HFQPYEGTAYRGMGNVPQAVIDNYKPGAIVVERAFTSTSPKSKVPFGFNPETLFVMNVRKGNDISSVNAFGEAEVLLRPNTRFKVVDVVEINGGNGGKDLWPGRMV